MTRLPNTGWPWLKRLQSHILWPGLGRRLGIELFHSTAYHIMYAGRARSVLTIHDIASIVHPEFFPSTRLIRKQNRTMVRDLFEANTVLASSRNTREDILQLLGLPADRVRTVLLGVHEGQFRPIVDPAVIDSVKG